MPCPLPGLLAQAQLLYNSRILEDFFWQSHNLSVASPKLFPANTKLFLGHTKLPYGKHFLPTKKLPGSFLFGKGSLEPLPVGEFPGFSYLGDGKAVSARFPPMENLQIHVALLPVRNFPGIFMTGKTCFCCNRRYAFCCNRRYVFCCNIMRNIVFSTF